jgi:hypothetical protein
MAINNWSNGSGGNWNSIANWSLGDLPLPKVSSLVLLGLFELLKTRLKHIVLPFGTWLNVTY